MNDFKMNSVGLAKKMPEAPKLGPDESTLKKLQEQVSEFNRSSEGLEL